MIPLRYQIPFFLNGYLIPFLLTICLIAPNVMASVACCHVPGDAAAVQLVQDDCCCPEGTSCAISSSSCDRDAVRAESALAGPEPAPRLRAALAADAAIAMRLTSGSRSDAGSADPPRPFQPSYSLPLRL